MTLRGGNQSTNFISQYFVFKSTAGHQTSATFQYWILVLSINGTKSRPDVQNICSLATSEEYLTKIVRNWKSCSENIAKCFLENISGCEVLQVVDLKQIDININLLVNKFLSVIFIAHIHVIHEQYTHKLSCENNQIVW